MSKKTDELFGESCKLIRGAAILGVFFAFCALQVADERKERGLIPDDYVLRLFSKCLAGNSCSIRRSCCRSGFKSLPKLPSNILRLPPQLDPFCGKLDKHMRRRQRSSSERCPLPDCCYKFCCRVFCYVTIAALLGLGLIVLF